MSDRWAHQVHEFQIGREKRARALLWPMRSGKSRACIDKACYQYNQGHIRGVIVIAPNGVHLNWAVTEIPKWSPASIVSSIFAWQTEKRGDPNQVVQFDRLLQHRGMKWLCINMEALKHLACRQAARQFIQACGGTNTFMMVISEAHHFGRPGAKRTFFARSLARHAAFRQIESGTIILNSPLRAFSIYETLKRRALGYATFKEFQARYAEFETKKRGSGRHYRAIKGYVNMDELRAKLAQWSSVVLREDIHDMPELLRTERPVVMSEVQRRAYLQMVAQHLAEIDGREFAVRDAGARVQKLQQILNGYLMTDGEIVTIDEDAPIYEALMEQIDGTLPGKSLVWCRFREDIRRVTKLLHHRGLRFVEYHGGVPLDQREADRHRFLNDIEITVCVGQPQAGGEGRDFSSADAVIFFSSIPNAITIKQAEERATVKGGRTVSIVRVTTPGTVDDRNWEIVDGKAALADSISGRGLRDLLLRTDV